MSIDTPEFRDLVSRVWQAYDIDARDERIKPLISYIDSRTAPVSAPLDTQALPPLPEYPPCSDVQHGLLYTERQLRNFALSAIAPYAARIAHLERELKQAKLQELADIGQDIERELAERKPVSIDSNQFRDLLAKYASSTFCGFGEAEAKAALIAYIDGRTAGTAPEGYVLVPLEPTPAMCLAGADVTAKIPKGSLRRFHMGETYKAMIAVAPSPQSKQEEA
jgi:hypothetical protein